MVLLAAFTFLRQKEFVDLKEHTRSPLTAFFGVLHTLIWAQRDNVYDCACFCMCVVCHSPVNANHLFGTVANSVMPESKSG